MRNPYLETIDPRGNSPASVALRTLGPVIGEHIEGFGDRFKGRCRTAEEQVKRVEAHQMLRIAGAAGNQANFVAHEHLRRNTGQILSVEAALSASTVKSNITDFIRQWIHTSLDVYPRLVSRQLVSVQPFTQPHGYVFFLERIAKDNGPTTGSGAGRNLSTLSTFDKEFGDRSAEGDQVLAVGAKLTKQLVEVKYKALMHQHSHEVDVAMRSQFGISLESFGDVTTAEELAWEVDREIIDALVTFAETNTRGVMSFDTTKGGGYAALSPSEQKAYDKSFITSVVNKVKVQMSSDIYRQPNFMLAGENVVELLNRSPEAMAEVVDARAMRDQRLVSGSIAQTAIMRDGMTIWHDPQLDADTAIIGYTDNMNPFYAGYIFSPFGLASLLTAAFQDPDNLMTRKARAIAFAKVGVRAQQYRKITLTTS